MVCRPESESRCQQGPLPLRIQGQMLPVPPGPHTQDDLRPLSTESLLWQRGTNCGP